jgi:hypothetical protein
VVLAAGDGEERCARILDDPKIEVYAATDRAGIELGMLELDFRVTAIASFPISGWSPS